MKCSTSSCPATCDGAVKATISGISGYGITVDQKKRVWISNGSTKRYDPSAPADQRLTLGAKSGSGGIAADANGWVWASNGDKTLRLNADTMDSTSIASPNKGVAIDTKGRVITIRNTGVHLIEPGNTLQAFNLTKDAATLKGFAYAYSDMTGVQTRLASDIPGWYRHPFEGCKTGTTTWSELSWDVDVPPGTSVVFHVRSADTSPTWPTPSGTWSPASRPPAVRAAA